MASREGGNSNFWLEIGASEENRPQIGITYGRQRNPDRINSDAQAYRNIPKPAYEVDGEHRVSLVVSKRISWKRSLSIRGRTSIVISGHLNHRLQPKQREAKRKPRNAIQSRKTAYHSDFCKEKEYFQEVDSFELMEESPSPKNFGTWVMGQQNAHAVHDLPSILERWMISDKLTYGCGPSGSLSKIWETPILPTGSTYSEFSDSSNEKTPDRTSNLSFKSVRPSSIIDNVTERHTHSQESSIINVLDKLHIDGACEDTHEGAEVLEEGDATREDLGVKKLSLTASLISVNHQDTFTKLLMLCGQSVPSTLLEVFSHYCNGDLSSIVKIGEGTYGEAFKAGATVCKIVPIDGDILVNGEVQKRSSELLEEVLLCWSLGTLRGQGHNKNNCTNFIETKDVRVCQGAYDASLIKAWEDWDAKNGSENDHPKEFSEKQCYVVFVLEDGGRDLESFVLLNFDEARSLLVQVTAALAVAEVAFEFEHRDLHWGNILLTRNDVAAAEFTIQGNRMRAKTFGLSISIIDFTLSRIRTGEAILFLDLSADPGLFEGPKGDRQSETYRKMKEVTEECWEGSFPKTNVLWLQYLVDILLLKKTFQRTAKDERALRSLKKSLNSCDTAKDALLDPFFSELWVDVTM